jgi:DNA-binding transcriptional ArsR family regulator
MVEHTFSLDSVFSSLSDSTRRDILKRVCGEELSVGQVAKPYSLTFAAVSKHLKVLEGANLITKKRRGKEQIVSAVPLTLKQAEDYLSNYKALWEERYDQLEKLLKTVK